MADAHDRAGLQQPRFLTSATAPRQFPAPQLPEVAFAGRSNAGKSSAINAICARRGLARTSKTPGRTQMINFFALSGGGLVDLPGYGYARVPPRQRAAWQRLVEAYLAGRATLRGVVLVMDIRHPLTPFDAQLLDWGKDIDFHILLTKADKISRSAQAQTLRSVQARLPGLEVQLFSATRNLGLPQAQARLLSWYS